MDEILMKRRSDLKRMLLPLEWDKKLRQINEGKEILLKAYKIELEKIELEITANAQII
jgi:hypothetical protein